eukprot:3733051-Prymnesium_polylepis.1
MSLEPEGRQLELLAAVVNATRAAAIKSGKLPSPVVVVLVHGRPVSFDGTNLPAAGLEGIDAMLAAWRPGEEGGAAIANLLLGDVNPSGKLAQAWQRSVGYIYSPTSPWYQPHSAMTPGKYFGNGDRTPLAPLFPFAHGLSYTTFTFEGLQVDAAGLPSSASGPTLSSLTVNLTINVTNNGTVAGATPVLATYSKTSRGVVRYLQMLCAFTKVYLQPGESRAVKLPVKLSDLARYDPAAILPGGGQGASPSAEVGHGDRRSSAAGDGGRSAYPGAYVVDGGIYNFFAAGCVANNALRDVHHEGDPTCPYHSAIFGASASIGREGDFYGVYL